MGFLLFLFSIKYSNLPSELCLLATIGTQELKKTVILTNNFLPLGDKANYKLGCTIKFVIFNNLITLIVCQMTLS